MINVVSLEIVTRTRGLLGAVCPAPFFVGDRGGRNDQREGGNPIASRRQRGERFMGLRTLLIILSIKDEASC